MPSEIARNELNWFPLTARQQFHKAIPMYKYLHKNTEGTDMNLILSVTWTCIIIIPEEKNSLCCRNQELTNSNGLLNTPQGNPGTLFLPPYGIRNLLLYLNMGTKPYYKLNINFNLNCLTGSLVFNHCFG